MEPITSVKKVGIIGTSPSSRHLAPFDKPDWEIWGMGPAIEDDGKPCVPGFPPTRSDRWFEIHQMTENDPELGAVVNPGYWAWLKKQLPPQKIVYYRPPLYKDLPGREFPWDEILERHGGYFLDSTPAWMMAFAYDYFPELTDIGLYGVDFASIPERREQKKGCYHFIRIFKLRGVTVHVPAESDMSYEPPPYPEVDPFEKKLNAQKAYLENRRLQMDTNRERLKQAMINEEAGIIRCDGALEDIDYWLGNRV